MGRALSLLFILMLPAYAAIVQMLPDGNDFFISSAQRTQEDLTTPQLKDISSVIADSTCIDYQSRAFIKPSEYLALKDWTSLDYWNAVYSDVDRTLVVESIDFVKRKDEDEPKYPEETPVERDMESSPLPDSVSALLSVFDFLKPLKHKTAIVTICFLIIAVYVKSFLAR